MKKKTKAKKTTTKKAPQGYVIARGSGAARPQYFRVGNGNRNPGVSIG